MKNKIKRIAAIIISVALALLMVLSAAIYIFIY